MRKTPLVMAVWLAGISLSGCSLEADQADQEPSRSVQQAAPQVEVMRVSPSPVVFSQKMEGFLVASQSAQVRPQINAQIDEILFEQGGIVKAGDVLYRLDDRQIRAELNGAKASLAQARAMLASAEREARRAESLQKENAVSQEAYERAMTARATAKASVEQAHAEVERQKVRASHARIEAPFSGRVGRSHVDVGNLVSATQAEPLVVIHDVEQLFLDVSLSGRQYLDIRQSIASGAWQDVNGQGIPLYLESGERYSHEARKLFFEPDVSRSTGEVRLRLEVDNPEGWLMPGMFVRVDVPYGQQDEALTIPGRALSFTHRGEAQVMVVDDDNLVQSRIVRLGPEVQGGWVIEHGLSSGDRMVINGLQRARPGIEVSPLEVGEATASGGEA